MGAVTVQGRPERLPLPACSGSAAWRTPVVLVQGPGAGGSCGERRLAINPLPVFTVLSLTLGTLTPSSWVTRNKVYVWFQLKHPLYFSFAIFNILKLLPPSLPETLPQLMFNMTLLKILFSATSCF